MAGFATGTGSLKYDGITFPVQIGAKVHAFNELDSTGRYTKQTRYTLVVDCIFHNDIHDTAADGPLTGTLDAGWADMRRRLMQSGKTLIFTDKGFGTDFNINTTKQDVVFGPHPKVMLWEPVGDNRAVHCIWQCEVVIAECSQINATHGRILELSYGMRWAINEDGLTTRTVRGFIEIANGRTGNRLKHTADSYRNKMVVPVPLGYKRVNNEWDLEPSKSRIHFSLTDEELPSDNPYFPGVIRPSVEYEIENSSQGGFNLWNASLSGSIEVAQGFPRWFAWAAFLLIYQSKAKAATAARVRSGKGGIVLVYGLRIGEAIFGRGMRFSLRWLLSCDLPNLFQASGMWAVVDGDWDSWRVSMSTVGLNWSDRGSAQMAHSTGEDALVSICEEVPPVRISDTVRRVGPQSQYQVLQAVCPEARYSWLAFQNSVKLVEDTNRLPLYHVGQTSPDVNPQLQPEDTSPDFPQSPGADDVIYHQYSNTKYEVVMEGWAMRVCHPIPPKIELERYGGKKATKIGKPYFEVKRIADFGIPVYIARWKKTYSLAGPPRGDSTVINPDPRKFQ